MHTASSNPTPLASPLQQEAEGIIRRCVHCGFCNATCPSYQLLGDELDGPRGRIYQVKMLLEGQPASAGIRLHLDRCLSCRACESTCPAGVSYIRLRELGEHMLDQQLRRRPSDRLWRALLSYLLRQKKSLQLALAVARIWPLSLAAKLYQRPSQALPQPTAAKRHILLLRGCVQPALTPQVDAAACNLLRSAGCAVHPIDIPCCGGISHHLGEVEKARQMASQVAALCQREKQRTSADGVLVTASGCHAMLDQYALLLGDDLPPDSPLRNRLHVADLLADSALKLRADVPRKMVFHPPCTWQHALAKSGDPRPLLTAAGAQLYIPPGPALCCGSAGPWSLLHPKMARDLRQRRLQQLNAGDAEAIVTANIGCQMHLQAGSALPVRHWLEVLEKAD